MARATTLTYLWILHGDGLGPVHAGKSRAKLADEGHDACRALLKGVGSALECGQLLCIAVPLPCRGSRPVSDAPQDQHWEEQAADQGLFSHGVRAARCQRTHEQAIPAHLKSAWDGGNRAGPKAPPHDVLEQGGIQPERQSLSIRHGLVPTHTRTPTFGRSRRGRLKDREP